MDITFLQTSDPFRYADMLAITARTVIEFCRRNHCAYESYVGMKRGIWPWQATYNRVIQLQELVDRGYRGWAIYLDADAYIVDLNFDVHAYLADKEGYAAILTPSMSTNEAWDINVGVCLINCGHTVGRDIITEWNARFARIDDARLREAEVWLEYDNDQDMMQQMLIAQPALFDHIFIQTTDLINSSYARFIRQHMRGYTTTFEERLEAIATEVNDVIADSGATARDKLLDASRCGVVAGLYQALLGRLPDQEGAANAVAELARYDLGDGVRHFASEILASQEFILKHPR